MNGISDDSKAVKRFRREAKALESVSDPHIVKIMDYVEQCGHPPCLMMEYVHGGSLKQWLDREGRLSARQAAKIVRDIGQGLAAAHDAGLVHRDIKPANILIDDLTGEARIADFGLAKLVEQQNLVTAESVTVGTPAYMSPEQITDPSEVDHSNGHLRVGSRPV